EPWAVCIKANLDSVYIKEIGNQARLNIFNLTVLKPSNLYEEVIEVDERIDLASEFDDSNLVTGISSEKVRIVKSIDKACLRPLLNGLLEKDKCSVYAIRWSLASKSRFLGHKAVLSGSADGVVRYSQTLFEVETEKPLIGFDMGGTSTDVSRYAGSYEQVLETQIVGAIIQTPQLNISTVATSVLIWSVSHWTRISRDSSLAYELRLVSARSILVVEKTGWIGSDWMTNKPEDGNLVWGLLLFKFKKLTDLELEANQSKILKSTDLVTRSGTDLASAAGTDLELSAGTDLELSAGTDLELSAGTDLELSAGTDLELSTGTDLVLGQQEPI
nr:5-oxoprolinase [Tanacetum cinerariifolium]